MGLPALSFQGFESGMCLFASGESQGGSAPPALFNRVVSDPLCDGDRAGFVVGQREDEQIRDASSVILSLPACRTGTGGREDDPSRCSLHSARARIEDLVIRIEFRRRRRSYAACCL